VPPIVETMLDLVSRADPDYQEKLRHNIILAGGGSQIAGLGEALTAALAEVGGGRVLAVQDPVFAGSNGSLAIALEAPDMDWEKLQG
jgi:rod shape-determining protein MreB